MTTSRTGMTLLEVLVVVVILGLLATTLAAGLSGKFGKAKHEIARIQVTQISSSIEAFKLDKRRIPTQEEGLTVLNSSPTSAFYLEASKLVDPWGQSFIYLVPGPNGLPFEVLTYGGDGKTGGEGEDADISSTDTGR